MSVFSFPRAPDGALSEQPGDLARAIRNIAGVVNRLLAGKLNALVEVTLTANVASTILSDARLTVNSYVDFDPVTSNAATEKANGTVYVTSANRTNGQFTITHANNAQADRIFKVLIIG